MIGLRGTLRALRTLTEGRTPKVVLAPGTSSPWVAAFDEAQPRFEGGSSPEEALGRLMLRHKHKLGLVISIQQESVDA